jgi:hypothetical protein
MRADGQISNKKEENVRRSKHNEAMPVETSGQNSLI